FIASAMLSASRAIIRISTHSNFLSLPPSCQSSQRSLCQASQAEEQLAGSNYRLVYRGPKNAMVRGVKAFSLATSSAGLCGQAFVIMAGRGGAVDAVLIGGLGLFSLATPLLLHLFTSSYVFWLFANTDGTAYRAVTKTVLLRNRFIDFRPDEVALTETGIPFANLSVPSNGAKLFVDAASSLDFDSVAKIFQQTTGRSSK
ncbi:hypothetical protein BOX15_Mlig017907g1, partial [Macrostomum lignano]